MPAMIQKTVLSHEWFMQSALIIKIFRFHSKHRPDTIYQRTSMCRNGSVIVQMRAAFAGDCFRIDLFWEVKMGV